MNKMLAALPVHKYGCFGGHWEAGWVIEAVLLEPPYTVFYPDKGTDININGIYASVKIRKGNGLGF